MVAQSIEKKEVRPNPKLPADLQDDIVAAILKRAGAVLLPDPTLSVLLMMATGHGRRNGAMHGR
jgi:hypothetical protein